MSELRSHILSLSMHLPWLFSGPPELWTRLFLQRSVREHGRLADMSLGPLTEARIPSCSWEHKHEQGQPRPPQDYA